MSAQPPEQQAGQETAQNSRPIIHDVLASRYASSHLLQLWSAEGKIRLERQFWIAVLKGQQSLGMQIASHTIEAFEKEQDYVDLASIETRERALRHDVKARIEEFCALAGTEGIHQGLTSRDLTDNVEQVQIHRSVQLLCTRVAAVLMKLGEKAQRYQALPLVARTHNVPAQPTTFGKRLAMFGEELLLAFEALERLAQHYPLRGLKGAVGTRLDLLTLLGEQAQTNASQSPSFNQVAALEQQIAEQLGFVQTLSAVGQIYPRGLDFQVVSALYQVGAALSGLAHSFRLMCGQNLLSEGFKGGQVGSSAMPHKTNARNCERINGFQTVLAGYLEMTARLAGGQWNEGDVACSVVRRVALPSAMFAVDGALETMLTVLDEMLVFETVLHAEVRREMPFLCTTTLLMEGIKAGGGRETLHKVLQEHTLALAAQLRETPGTDATTIFFKALVDDVRFPLQEQAIQSILSDVTPLLGEASQQAGDFSAKAMALVQRYPQAQHLQAEPIL